MSDLNRVDLRLDGRCAYPGTAGLTAFHTVSNIGNDEFSLAGKVQRHGRACDDGVRNRRRSVQIRAKFQGREYETDWR